MSIHSRISKKYCPRFGQLSIEMGYITVDQLKDAMNIQVDDNISGKDHRLIGSILFDKNWMSSEQIEIVLNLLLKQMRTETTVSERKTCPVARKCPGPISRRSISTNRLCLD